MNPKDKVLVWREGKMKNTFFSSEARIEAAYRLQLLQKGGSLSMPQSCPVTSMGKGCHELRINDENKTLRIIYRIEDDSIVVVHVFAKKTNKTLKQIKEQVLFLWQRLVRNQKRSPYAKKRPKGISFFVRNEELQSYLVDYRRAWYGNKRPTYWTHLIVWLKTWHFVFVEIIWKQSITKIELYFKPLHKPRLPRK